MSPQSRKNRSKKRERQVYALQALARLVGAVPCPRCGKDVTLFVNAPENLFYVPPQLQVAVHGDRWAVCYGSFTQYTPGVGLVDS